MTQANWRGWAITAAVSTMAVVFPSSVSAQGPKQLSEKLDSAAVYRSLGEVITLGVKLFNDQSDYAGCYRVFQGSLLSVRPVLASELQKKIDAGIADAEKQPTFADRAFALRAVLDDIRKQLKPAAPKGEEKKTEKKAEEKKAEEKKAEKKAEEKKAEKKVDEKKSSAPDHGQLVGKASFQGQAIAGGYFVTLVRGDKRYSSTLQKDGSFHFATPIPPGEYAVAFEPIRGDTFKGVALPPRYAAETASGLTITVKGGKQQVDLNLAK